MDAGEGSPPALKNIPAEELALWRRYARTRSTADRNALCERYLSLCRHITARIHQRCHAAKEFGELLSAAHSGLLAAVPRFRLERGVHPRTYLTWRIRGAILDYLRDEDNVSRTRRQRLNEIEAWSQTLDHTPTREEIQQQFGRHMPATVRMCSLDAPAASAGKTVTIGDIIPDRHGTDIFASVGDCSYLLRGMNPRERLLLLLYYVEGLSMREVGQSLGVSESLVSQQIAQLRTRLARNARAA